ncbi:MAG: tRNA (adenosine(37)-N6)-threonylcarbamoyltransferase complex dimerization subunit type 1 TsaB, partial [Pseudomonadota bacterium]|nr:tRNA (adenosine(37)-N6)-threonylcarbamoyltransferase complex dimerization subunit type 1 TsaB [Pseudomonadota bacterium]
MHAHPPSVLAIDTATEVCSVALLHGDTLTELIEQVGSRHSERVLPMIDTLLSNAGLQLADIDLFAFGAGPGSFTGLRIACGVAQGLAYGSQKRVVPIGNLRALAAGVFDYVDQGDRLLAAIDARMQEAY